MVLLGPFQCLAKLVAPDTFGVGAPVLDHTFGPYFGA